MLGEGSPEALKGLSEADLAEFGFFSSGGNGFSIGRSLDYCEYEGKGLPEWKNGRQLFVELNVNFVVRVTCDRGGTTYLEIHQAGNQSFHSFPFQGIEYRDAVFAAVDFQQRLSHFLINYAMYPLFWALYREKETDSKKKNDAYNAIEANFKTFFKNILKPKREREIGVIEENEIKITSYESIESGRNLQPEAEKQEERIGFLKDVFKAFSELDKKKITKPKQKDLRPYIFPRHADKEKKISEMKKKHRLDYKDLWQKYLTNKTLDGFLSALNTER